MLASLPNKVAGLRVIAHDATIDDVRKQQSLAIPSGTFSSFSIRSGDEFKFPTHGPLPRKFIGFK